MNEPREIAALRAFSARLGKDRFRVQGPGGNTSIKQNGVMWVKASGTELADADRKDIFVAVDHGAAREEALENDGDGSCRSTVLDPGAGRRPSIETTFHAALDWPIVAHTHSIAVLVHAVAPQGRSAAAEKLAGLPVVFVPYAKPGLPLTRQILARVTPATRVIVLENHGLICCGADVEQTAGIMDEVEDRLAMPARDIAAQAPDGPAADGFSWASESWMARDRRAASLACTGSYYPDHVVFLGPALPQSDHDGHPPAIMKEGEGILLRDTATSSQKAMLRCLSDLLRRVPLDWTPEPIGAEAEAELLDWDAEKYRQSLAARA